MGVQTSLIAETETAINSGSPEKRVETLRRVTELFLNGAERFDEEQVQVFDDVLGHLIKRIESKAVAELSTRLAPVDNAPVEVIRQLARHDEIAVAVPVLIQSTRLSDDDLVDIAKTKSQGHLLALSGREQLAEAVTDVLIDRGDREVVHTLARNNGARFSETGFTTLVKTAETDDALAEKVGLSLDVPAGLLQELLVKASETVRAKLLQHAPPQTKDEVQRVLANITNEVRREAAAPRDYSAAIKHIEQMHKQGALNEAVMLEFANAGQYEELTVGLATLCSTPVNLIAPLFVSDRNDGLLVPCKAAGLKWPTVSAMLANRFAHHTISDEALAQARADYLTL